MTADEMRTWLTAAGARSSCTFCGSNEWVSLEDVKGHLQRFRTARIDADGKQSDRVGLTIVAIACTNCGHVETFSFDVLSDLSAMVPDFPPEG